VQIGIVEWDISAMGGRHRDMLAFADLFTEAGHDVEVLTDWGSDDAGWTSTTFLEWFPFEHLDYGQFHWEVKNRNQVPPRRWEKFDVLLCSYGHWGYLGRHLPRTRIICYVLLPSQNRHGDPDIWVNSATTRRRLAASKIWGAYETQVVRPPHNYAPWRDAAKESRDNDVVILGSLLHAKGVLEAARTCKKLGVSYIVIGATWPAARDENTAIEADLRSMGAELYTNVRYTTVADIMGRSRVYLSMSQAESASLAIYEAMNAGCQVVARDVGAAREQAGSCGHLFRVDTEAPDMIRRALTHNPVPASVLTARGMRFDRLTIGHEALTAITQ